MPTSPLAAIALLAMQVSPTLPSNRVVNRDMLSDAIPKVPTVKITVTLTGGGGTVTVGSFVCRAAEEESTKVCTGRVAKDRTIAAQPSKPGGIDFSEWGGACSGSGACTVQTNADVNLSASFTLIDAQELIVDRPSKETGLYVTPKWMAKSDPNTPRVTYRIRTGRTVEIRMQRPKTPVEWTLGKLHGDNNQYLWVENWTDDCAQTKGTTCTLVMNRPRRVGAK